MKPILLFLLAGFSSLLADPGEVKNGGFEAESANGRIDDWFVPPPAVTDGWAVRLADDAAKEGKRCAVLEHSGESEPQAFGNIMQSRNAESLRGKRVRLSAEVRHRGLAESRSQLWLRVDLPQRKMGFLDNSSNRPATVDEWKRFEIICDVDNDAVSLNFGLMTFGKGSVSRLDDVKLEILGASVPIEVARELTERGLANVTAFVRLVGYVRYFHPSDQAAALTADGWDRLTVSGLREVESAADAADLAARLTKIFQPIAPTVSIAMGKSATSMELPRGSHVQTWQHRGYAFGSEGKYSPYSNTRIRKSAQADVAQPWTSELGGGVACSVPLTLFDDGTATLPKMETKPAPPVSEPPLSAKDRAARLTVVASAWNVMQHFYPYFDVVKTDWPATLDIALRSAATDADEAAFFRTFQRLGAALRDGHCWTGGPGAPHEMHPALFLKWADGKLCVAYSKVPTISPGDALLEIDGVSVEQAVKERLALWSVPSPQGAELKSALNVLAGAPQSELRLVIEPFSAPGTRREVTVKRDLPSPFSVRPKRERKKDLAPGILYLDLDQWTQAELDADWAELGKARGLIFEFRNYPNKLDPMKFFGSFSAQSVTSAKFLVPSITRPDRAGMVYSGNGGWRLSPQPALLKNPTAFLIDAESISYAESCMSIVEHHHLAELVGTPTMGTNGNMVHAKLPAGFSMSFTAMKVLKQDDTPHHSIGIRPTAYAAPTRKGLAEGRDEVVEKALEILLKKSPADSGTDGGKK